MSLGCSTFVEDSFRATPLLEVCVSFRLRRGRERQRESRESERFVCLLVLDWDLFNKAVRAQFFRECVGVPRQVFFI